MTSFFNKLLKPVKKNDPFLLESTKPSKKPSKQRNRNTFFAQKDGEFQDIQRSVAPIKRNTMMHHAPPDDNLYADSEPMMNDEFGQYRQPNGFSHQQLYRQFQEQDYDHHEQHQQAEYPQLEQQQEEHYQIQEQQHEEHYAPVFDEYVEDQQQQQQQEQMQQPETGAVLKTGKKKFRKSKFPGELLATDSIEDGTVHESLDAMMLNWDNFDKLPLDDPRPETTQHDDVEEVPERKFSFIDDDLMAAMNQFDRDVVPIAATLSPLEPHTLVLLSPIPDPSKRPAAARNLEPPKQAPPRSAQPPMQQPSQAPVVQRGINDVLSQQQSKKSRPEHALNRTDVQRKPAPKKDPERISGKSYIPGLQLINDLGLQSSSVVNGGGFRKASRKAKSTDVRVKFSGLDQMIPHKEVLASPTKDSLERLNLKALPISPVYSPVEGMDVSSPLRRRIADDISQKPASLGRQAHSESKAPIPAVRNLVEAKATLPMGLYNDSSDEENGPTTEQPLETPQAINDLLSIGVPPPLKLKSPVSPVRDVSKDLPGIPVSKQGNTSSALDDMMHNTPPPPPAIETLNRSANLIPSPELPPKNSDPAKRKIKRRHIQIQARPVDFRTVGVQVGNSKTAFDDMAQELEKELETLNSTSKDAQEWNKEKTALKSELALAKDERNRMYKKLQILAEERRAMAQELQALRSQLMAAPPRDEQ